MKSERETEFDRLLKRVVDISLDYEDFDGDRRGIRDSLLQAEDELRVFAGFPSRYEEPS